MYDYIKGTITNVLPNNITVENNNIGYLIKTPNPYQFKTGDEVIIYTYQYVREDLIDFPYIYASSLNGFAVKNPDDERKDKGITSVPTSFEKCIEVLKNSKFLEESLGPNLVKHLIQRDEAILKGGK